MKYKTLLAVYVICYRIATWCLCRMYPDPQDRRNIQALAFERLQKPSEEGR